MMEVDELTTRSFCDGLPLEYRLQMKNTQSSPFEAFAMAKALSKRQELDKQRYGTRDKTDSGRRDESSRRPYTYPISPRPYNQNYSRNYNSNNTRDSYTRGNDNASRNTYTRDNDNAPRNTYTRGNDNAPRNIYTRSSDNASRDNYARMQPRDRNERPQYINRDTRNTSGNSNVNNDRSARWCRYCKNSGHEIEECRKRQYNNSRKESGNASGPARQPGVTRQGPSQSVTRPVNPVEATTFENTESQL